MLKSAAKAESQDKTETETVKEAENADKTEAETAKEAESADKTEAENAKEAESADKAKTDPGASAEMAAEQTAAEETFTAGELTYKGTGDTTNIYFWLLLLVLSNIMLGAVWYMKKKMEEDTNQRR